MKLIFLDTETTDNTPDCKLIQLAYKVEGSEPVNKLYKPVDPINFEAMAVHHITEEMVAGKPAFKDSAEFNQLQELLNDGVLVAHNAAFDVGVLEREGLVVPNVICTLKLAMTLLDEPTYKLQVLRYKYGLNIEGATAHDALGDILILEQLYNYLFKKSSDVAVMADYEFKDWAVGITSKPVLLRRISFGKHKGTEFAKIPKDYLRWLQSQSDVDADMVFTINHYLNA